MYYIYRSRPGTAAMATHAGYHLIKLGVPGQSIVSGQQANLKRRPVPTGTLEVQILQPTVPDGVHGLRRAIEVAGHTTLDLADELPIFVGHHAVPHGLLTRQRELDTPGLRQQPDPDEHGKEAIGLCFDGGSVDVHTRT